VNYYQHHIGDFNNATRHLTRVERALYRELIELYYDKEQPLTSDKNRLAKLTICQSEEDISALDAVLEEYFTLEDGLYYNSRCEIEIEKYKANTSAKARAGKASAEARKNKRSTGVQHVLNSVATERQRNPTNQEPRTSNQEPRTKNHKPKEEEALPLSLNMNAWDEFVLHRTQINKPMKALAKTKAVNILKDLPFDQQQNVVDYSIAGGYTGLFANQSQNNRGNGSAERVIPEYIPEGQRDGISVINSTAERVND